jgi:hypothetical protein
MGLASRDADDGGAPALPECAAVLIAGFDPDEPARARDLARMIGELDQTLRSTQARWAIRRLTPVGDERLTPTRVGIKGALDGVARQASDVVIVMIAGVVTLVAGEPALITGATYRSFPDDATLSLRWIGRQLIAVAGPQVVIVLSARQDESAPTAETWLAALAPPTAGHAVFVEADARGGALQALTSGLRGSAVDPETGTVTLRSLADYLVRDVSHVQTRAERRSHTIVRPASLDDLRALGWRRTDRAVPVERAGDLSCSVLRGEIRVDELLARGSFGEVYRAR